MKMFLPFLLILTALDFGLGATLTVTDPTDMGPGSLRQALVEAADGDIITFALPVPGSIGLTSGELVIDKDLTIIGPGAANLTIERDSASSDLFGIIEITAGHIVSISGITLAHGDGETGAIHNLGTVTLQNCAILENTAFDLGACAGAICNTGDLTILNSTIADNSTSFAPAGISSSTGILTLTNCTLSGNIVGGLANGQQIVLDPPQSPGGALFISGGSAVITNCTIAGNIAGFGGDGIYAANATVEIKNTIIAGNGTQDVSGELDSLGYNLIGNGDGATVTPMTGDQIGTATSPIDPLLGPLQDNGGPTETRALLAGSPAIDKGGAADGVVTDQRGRFRPVDAIAIPPAQDGDNSDIGAFEKQAAQSLNISTRLQVLGGENILDAGFIITGTDPKRVLVRGIGPSLAAAMVPNFLADPVLELHDSTSLLLTNDNWKDSQEAEIEATNLAPKNDAESALITTLEPGTYTAILSGKSGGTGIGLVEVYDLDSAAISTLANTSTRGLVSTGDNVMISGFILGAGEGVVDKVLVLALGPSLASAGVTNPLEDPNLELHDGNGALIASNDNWRDSNEAEIEATGLAPTDDREAALLQSLPAGPYTAIVRGGEEQSGIALVEIFDLH
jgi:hypothetical protein